MSIRKEPVRRRRDSEEPNLRLPREMVTPAILLLLRERKAHGYGLLEELEQLGMRVTDTGGLYRVLRDLEESKLVRSRWEPAEAGPARRVYQLTPKGEEELDTWGEAVRKHHELISNYLRRYQGHAADRETRAAGNGGA